MATKRVKLAPRAVLKLSPAQRSHLLTGAYLLPGEPFQNEAHRRAAWERHGEPMLVGWNRPGKRPAALWDYGVLSHWSQHGRTEREAVVRLLKAGKLAPCGLDGVVRISDEIAEIEGRVHGRFDAR